MPDRLPDRNSRPPGAQQEQAQHGDPSDEPGHEQHRVQGRRGLDVYRLGESLRGVLDYVRAHAPDHVETALRAFGCFEPYGEDQGDDGVSAGLVPAECREDVVRLLTGPHAEAGAERHYREMLHGGSRSWNTRDTHLSDTLDRLLHAYGPRSKAVVWAHNAHVGDARATDMAAAGMVNLG